MFELTTVAPFKLNNKNLRGVNFLINEYNLINKIILIEYTKKHLPVKYSDCHNNCIKYVDMYGGEIVSGYYLVSDYYNENNFVAFKHYVINKSNKLIDITPNEYFNQLSFIKSKSYNYLDNAPDKIELYIDDGELTVF